MNSLDADVAYLNQIATNNDKRKVVIFSARDPQTRSEERAFGYEMKQQYKNIDKNFYSLYSKVRLQRSFEQVW